MLPELSDLDAWLAEREAAVPGLRPGCEKRIDWPDARRVRAPLAVLYVHGFSATGREISPVPEDVARALGAPLHVTRLTGHGQDGAALAAATYDAWRADVAEALEVAQALGERVLVIGCSTGCTLVTAALGDGWHAEVAGVVFVSPNYGLRHKAAQWLLDAPGSRRWARYVTPREVSFKPKSEDHAAYWTCRYPPTAVFAADDAVRAARGCAVESVTVPAFFALCEADQVVNPARTRKIMARWGGPVQERVLVMGPGDDEMGHLIAGDIHSASQTAPLVADILAWWQAEGAGRSAGSDGQKKPGAAP